MIFFYKIGIIETLCRNSKGKHNCIDLEFLIDLNTIQIRIKNIDV